MKIKVYTATGDFSAEKDFAVPQYEGDKGVQALKQAILAYQANARIGNGRRTKNRSTVHGTGKKPFRQKGTGQARQGTKVGPQHYHGSVAFGPQGRVYTQKLPQKMRTLALGRALFERVSEGSVSVVTAWELEQPKTKLFDAVVSKIAPEQKRLLVVDAAWSDPALLAARNIARLDLGEAADLNALDLCDYDQIIISEKGIEKLLSRLNGGN